MKNTFLVLFLFSTFTTQLIGQTITCDTAAIYATTGANAVCTEIIQSSVRGVFSNNYPDASYTTFTFGTGATKTAVTEEDNAFYLCSNPQPNTNFLSIDSESTAGTFGMQNCPRYSFGVMVNGIYITPTTATYYTDDNDVEHTEWELEGLSSDLGWDSNNAHKQSSGRYHYHGDPVDYAVSLGYDGTQHSGIIAWAADGYPVYYKYGYSDPNDPTSAIVELTSCWGLRSGDRSTLGYADYPSGNFDGSYVEDYQYPAQNTPVANCVLDSANGRWAITPDFPNGTYHYVITTDWPQIPRFFKGTPDYSFRSGPGNCADTEAFTSCGTTVYNAAQHLPVSLTFFKGQPVEEYNLLEWQTASEENSSHFELERSTNGQDFEILDYIESAHFTTNVQNYSFQDFDLEATVYYYRLRMVDYDGTFEYSNVVAIQRQGGNYQSYTLVYPNPTRGMVNIETTQEQMITVRNTYGQVVLEKNIIGREQLDLSTFAAGIYLVSDGVRIQKLVVSH